MQVSEFEVCGNIVEVRHKGRGTLVHAMKFYDFVNERGGRVILRPVEGPPSEWASPLAAFEDALAHEQKVTGRIDDLVDLAVAERDHATQIFLQWFISEQVEEEALANEVVQKLMLIGDAAGGLLMPDRELAQRVFTTPSTVTEGGAEQ